MTKEKKTKQNPTWMILSNPAVHACVALGIVVNEIFLASPECRQGSRVAFGSLLPNDSSEGWGGTAQVPGAVLEIKV